MVTNAFIKFWHNVGGNSETDLQVRFYRLFCAIATILAFCVIIPADLLQNISPLVSISVGCFGLFTAYLYRAACQKKYFPTLFFLCLVLVLNITWFVNGGTQGSISSFFVAGIMYATIIFRGKSRWIWLALFLINIFILLLIDNVHPEWIKPFDTPHDRLIELSSGTIISALMCIAVIWTILHNYAHKELQLTQANRQLEDSLARLEKSLQEISTLQGLLPICSWCKNIRNDDGSWSQIEEFLEAHSEASFSHGLCPDCYEKHYPELHRKSQRENVPAIEGQNNK